MEVIEGSKFATLMGVKKDITLGSAAIKGIVQRGALNSQFNSQFNFQFNFQNEENETLK